MTKIKLIESEVIWILYYTECAYKVKECRIRWLFLSLYLSISFSSYVYVYKRCRARIIWHLKSKEMSSLIVFILSFAFPPFLDIHDSSTPTTIILNSRSVHCCRRRRPLYTRNNSHIRIVNVAWISVWFSFFICRYRLLAYLFVHQPKMSWRLPFGCCRSISIPWILLCLCVCALTPTEEKNVEEWEKKHLYFGSNVLLCKCQINLWLIQHRESYTLWLSLRETMKPCNTNKR